MEKEKIIEKVRNIIVAVVRHDDFEMKEELTAADVAGWDSLSHMMIITAIENEFKIRFKLKELNKLQEMRSLIALIQEKSNKA